MKDEVKSSEGSMRTFFAVTNVETVNIPFLIKNETRVTVGAFDAETTEFMHMQVVKNKGHWFLVISDTSGYIT